MRGQDGEGPCPLAIVEPNRKKKDFLFSPGKSSANERLSQLSQWWVTMLPTLISSNRLFVYYSTSTSFSTVKEFSACSVGLAQWLSLAIDRICKWLISSKPIFAGEITIVCLFQSSNNQLPVSLLSHNNSRKAKGPIKTSKYALICDLGLFFTDQRSLLLECLSFQNLCILVQW